MFTNALHPGLSTRLASVSHSTVNAKYSSRVRSTSYPLSAPYGGLVTINCTLLSVTWARMAHAQSPWYTRNHPLHTQDTPNTKTKQGTAGLKWRCEAGVFVLPLDKIN